MFCHSVSTLKRAREFFRLNPTGRLVVQPRDGFPLPLSADEFRAWFRDCLNRKINVRGGLMIRETPGELVRFHRSFTASRLFLRSRDIRCATAGCSARLRARLFAAFASRIDDDE